VWVCLSSMAYPLCGCCRVGGVAAPRPSRRGLPGAPQPPPPPKKNKKKKPAPRFFFILKQLQSIKKPKNKPKKKNIK
ncbi:hypothetical protein ACVGXT_00750, partial [Enterobacter intestinihominis]